MIKGNQQACPDVGVVFRFFQLELAAPDDDFFLMLDIVMEQFFQVQNFWFIVHQRQHDHTKSVLQLRMFVQLVQDHTGIGVAAQLDDNPHAGTVRLVPQICDSVDLPVPDQVGDFLNQPPLVDIVRQFGNDNLLLAAFHFFDFTFAPHNNPAFAGLIGFFYPFPTQNQASCGKIGAFDHLGQVFNGHVRIIDQHDDAVNHFAQVVGRDVRGHTYRDTRSSVHEQIGKPAGKDHRLLNGFVVVGNKIHSAFVDIPEHFHGQPGQPRLGVTHGGGRIIVHAAEIAVPVHQRITVGEVLGHADHGVVYG